MQATQETPLFIWSKNSNECGFDDVYGEEFPFRLRYSTDKIIESNVTLRVKKILEDFVDPRRFNGDDQVVNGVVDKISQLIKVHECLLYLNDRSRQVLGYKTANEVYLERLTIQA